MYRGNSQRIFPIILVIIVMVVAVAALVSLGQAVFRGINGNDASTEEATATRQALLATDTGRSVRMTIRGRIIADEYFRSIRVTVSPNERIMTTYSGYLDSVVGSKTYPNSVKAYEQFVYALEKANFTKSTKLSDDKNDLRGICAAGNVYEFEIMNKNNVIKRTWTSTCKGIAGSFKGGTGLTESLFIAQIPDYTALDRDLRRATDKKE